RPVTPGVAGSSPVHSATYIKPQSKDWGFFRFPEVCLHLTRLLPIIPTKRTLRDYTLGFNL
ncbi:hypothetical protein, partial [Vibrio alginolyticus]|uniref:hypothetical protein n=1 Tax=Vibrio alginolyticus TaxID=663 RepID=UPI003D7E3DBE